MAYPIQALPEWQSLSTRSAALPRGDNAVITDADTRFGDLDSRYMAAAVYKDAGIAACQIEDRAFPRTSGHTGVPDVSIPLKWKPGSLLQAA